MVSKLHFTNIVFYGAGSLQKIGEAFDQLQTKHIFVIISKRAKREATIILDIATKQEVKVNFFTDFSGEPTTEHVQLAIQQFQACGADCIVALGGGTPIDLGKAVAVLSKNKHLSIQQLHLQKNLHRYPLIAIPTTAGTGSEVTKVTVITDPSTNRKYNPSHHRFIPDIAILDPELTMTLPKNITAQTGMDALAHAMEAYVSTLANPFSDLFALEAIKIISTYLHKAYEEPDNLEAREGMLRGSYFAGVAFSNASTNLAHATARPLGTRFQLSHGLSVALTLPPVIEYGYHSAEKRYEEIAKVIGTDSVLDYVKQCNQRLHIYNEAKERIDAGELLKTIPILVEDALSGNGIKTNRKIPTENDVSKVYENIIEQLMEGKTWQNILVAK